MRGHRLPPSVPPLFSLFLPEDCCRVEADDAADAEEPGRQHVGTERDHNGDQPGGIARMNLV